MISPDASASLGSAPAAMCAGTKHRDRSPVQANDRGRRCQFRVDRRQDSADRRAILCRRRVANALRQRDEDIPDPRSALQSP